MNFRKTVKTLLWLFWHQGFFLCGVCELYDEDTKKDTNIINKVIKSLLKQFKNYLNRRFLFTNFSFKMTAKKPKLEKLKFSNTKSSYTLCSPPPPPQWTVDAKQDTNKNNALFIFAMDYDI